MVNWGVGYFCYQHLPTLVVCVWACEYPNLQLKSCRSLGTSEQLEAFRLQMFLYNASSNPCMPSQDLRSNV